MNYTEEKYKEEIEDLEQQVRILKRWDAGVRALLHKLPEYSLSTSLKVAIDSILSQKVFPKAFVAKELQPLIGALSMMDCSCNCRGGNHTHWCNAEKAQKALKHAEKIGLIEELDNIS